MANTGSHPSFPLYGFKVPNVVSDQDYAEFEVEYINTIRHRHERWDRYFPNSSECKKSRKLKRFCRKGIPPNDRGEVWLTVSGARNRMLANSGVYKTALSMEPDLKYTRVIDVDIVRTYPENIHFQGSDNNEGILRSLKNVLMAFAAYFPHIGYCQGFNFVAGVILLVLHGPSDEVEEKAFWLLDFLFNDILPTYYTDNMFSLKRDYYVLGELVRLSDPELHSHIIEQGLTFELLCTKWFICLYADVLPIETTLRVFDCLFYEGEKILFRVALALIDIHREEIFACKDFPEIINKFRKMSVDNRTLRCHQFMQAVFKSPRSFPRARIQKLRRQFEDQLEQSN